MINGDRFRVDIADSSDVDYLTDYLAALTLRSALTNDLVIFKHVNSMIRSYLTKADLDTTLKFVQLLLINATSNSGTAVNALRDVAPHAAATLLRDIAARSDESLQRLARVAKPTTPEGAS